MPLTLFFEGFQNIAKPDPTCILPLVRGGIFNVVRYAKISFQSRVFAFDPSICFVVYIDTRGTSQTSLVQELEI